MLYENKNLLTTINPTKPHYKLNLQDNNNYIVEYLNEYFF